MKEARKMLELLRPFWLEILKYGSIVVGVLLVLLRARQSGAQAEQNKQAMDTLKGVRTRDKIENDVITSGSGKLAKLRKKWER